MRASLRFVLTSRHGTRSWPNETSGTAPLQTTLMKRSHSSPSRGEIWLINLDPTLGHEQSGTRPCLVISADPLNHSPADLAIVLPLTSRERRLPSHVSVSPPEGGLRSRSFIKCEDIRSVSISRRFVRRWGSVSAGVLADVEKRLRFLLDMS
jgi:mRNA interferase MazF